MNIVRFAAALALICTNSLFAAEPGDDTVSSDGKVYYVITRKAGQDDSIARLPINGKDRVSDSISKIYSMQKVSGKKIWIAGLDQYNVGRQQILPVDWEAIRQRREMPPNYLILPGDRIYIDDPDNPTFVGIVDTWNKCTAPFQRLAGILGFGDQTIRGGSMGRNWERTLGGQ